MAMDLISGREDKEKGRGLKRGGRHSCCGESSLHPSLSLYPMAQGIIFMLNSIRRNSIRDISQSLFACAQMKFLRVWWDFRKLQRERENEKKQVAGSFFIENLPLSLPISYTGHKFPSNGRFQLLIIYWFVFLSFSFESLSINQDWSSSLLNRRRISIFRQEISLERWVGTV